MKWKKGKACLLQCSPKGTSEGGRRWGALDQIFPSVTTLRESSMWVSICSVSFAIILLVRKPLRFWATGKWVGVVLAKAPVLWAPEGPKLDAIDRQQLQRVRSTGLNLSGLEKLQSICKSFFTSGERIPPRYVACGELDLQRFWSYQLRGLALQHSVGSQDLTLQQPKWLCVKMGDVS